MEMTMTGHDDFTELLLDGYIEMAAEAQAITWAFDPLDRESLRYWRTLPDLQQPLTDRHHVDTD
jgi:hypothetical protein